MSSIRVSTDHPFFALYHYFQRARLVVVSLRAITFLIRNVYELLVQLYNLSTTIVWVAS